jgi:cysteinyl-tRNA synthetase
MLKLHNSLTRKTEDFQPIDKDLVGFYTCGPTVYNFVHIGNLRTMIMADVLRRVLLYDKYSVKFVMNITDVGHLTSDGDSGDDKMEKNAKTVQDIEQIAGKYTTAFMENIRALNILPPDETPKATDHIKEQIEMIQGLIDKGLAYESTDAVYFDITKFADYTKLVGQDLSQMMLGARQEVVKDPNKHHPYDFVLWFKTMGRYQNHIQRWDSPWGEGFPGWHIECSAMSRKYLGDTFDIHAGGIDLKFPHHTNEIAQSEGYSGKKFVNYWIHGEHLLVGAGAKMSKSEGNFITLMDVIDKGFNPLAFRYLALTSHYRSRLNFTWESLTAAQNGLNNLYETAVSFKAPHKVIPEFIQKFNDAIDNDLDTPKALAITWEMIKSGNTPQDKLATLLNFDQVLGLRIKETLEAGQTIPDVVQELVKQREQARANKDFAKSDEIRKAIESDGYSVEDTADGVRIRKKF